MELGPYLPGFIAAYSILLVAASSPGPAVAFLLGIGTAQGRSAALAATGGIACGGVVLNLGTLLGLGLLLQEAAWAMQAIRFMGAAYLAWLSYKALRRAARSGALPPAPTTRPRSAAGLFLQGFLLQVVNIKAIIFWVAIAAVGATHGGGAGVIAAFVAGAFAISFTCHAAWALLLSSGPVRAGYARARRGIEAVLGGFFALFALRLATERS